MYCDGMSVFVHSHPSLPPAGDAGTRIASAVRTRRQNSPGSFYSSSASHRCLPHPPTSSCWRFATTLHAVRNCLRTTRNLGCHAAMALVSRRKHSECCSRKQEPPVRGSANRMPAFRDAPSFELVANLGVSDAHYLPTSVRAPRK